MRVVYSGVYIIFHQTKSRAYVGKSKDIHVRWKKHRSDLRSGKHHSRFLQRDWDKSGEGAFLFAVLEVCPPRALREVEQRYLSMAPVYNGTTLSDDRSTVVLRPESREKMSRAKKGRHLPPDTILNMKAAAARLWADPQYRQRALTNLRSAIQHTSKPIRATSTVTGEVRDFPSLAQAARTLGVSRSDISLHLTKRQRPGRAPPKASLRGWTFVHLHLK